MASAFTHALAAAALGSLLVPGRPRLIALGAALVLATHRRPELAARLGEASADHFRNL